MSRVERSALLALVLTLLGRISFAATVSDVHYDCMALEYSASTSAEERKRIKEVFLTAGLECFGCMRIYVSGSPLSVSISSDDATSTTTPPLGPICNGSTVYVGLYVGNTAGSGFSGAKLAESTGAFHCPAGIIDMKVPDYICGGDGPLKVKPYHCSGSENGVTVLLADGVTVAASTLNAPVLNSTITAESQDFSIRAVYDLGPCCDPLTVTQPIQFLQADDPRCIAEAQQTNPQAISTPEGVEPPSPSCPYP